MYALMITSATETFSTRTFLRVTHVEKRNPNSSHELFNDNSSKTLCEDTHRLDRGYAENFIEEALSEVHFKDRKLALQQ